MGGGRRPRKLGSWSLLLVEVSTISSVENQLCGADEVRRVVSWKGMFVENKFQSPQEPSCKRQVIKTNMQWSSYYWEVKRIAHWKKSGASADNIYKPSFPCFAVEHSILKKNSTTYQTESNLDSEVQSDWKKQIFLKFIILQQ